MSKRKLTKEERFSGSKTMVPWKIFQLHEMLCKDGVPHTIEINIDGEYNRFSMSRPDYFIKINNDSGE